MTFINHFSQFLLFLSEHLSGYAPLILDVRGRSSVFSRLPFFDIYPCIFSQNSVVGCPPGGCPGPSHPPHPPVHSTVWASLLVTSVIITILWRLHQLQVKLEFWIRGLVLNLVRHDNFIGE